MLFVEGQRASLLQLIPKLLINTYHRKRSVCALEGVGGGGGGFQERKPLLNLSPTVVCPHKRTDGLFSIEQVYSSSLLAGAFLPCLITSEISSLFDLPLAATSDTFPCFQQPTLHLLFVKHLMPSPRGGQANIYPQ